MKSNILSALSFLYLIYFFLRSFWQAKVDLINSLEKLSCQATCVLQNKLHFYLVYHGSNETNQNIQMGSGSCKEKAQKEIPVGSSPEDVARRKKIFREFDVNGNNYLSLAEIDKGIRDVLNMPQLFETKPVIMRAYQASKNKIKAKSSLGQDYVTRAEFKWTLIYLRFFYQLWEDFEKIDVDNERRISEKEFINGAPILINQWKLKIDDPKETFAALLKKNNAQAHITFTEFCDYIIQQRLKQFDDLNTQEEI